MQRLSLSLAFSVLSFFLPLSLVAGVPDGQAVKQAQSTPTKPLSFIENKGQITDQHGSIRNDIDFKLEGGGVTIFIGNGQMHYQWCRPKAGGAENETEIWRMDVRLLGANPGAELIAEEPQPYYERHYPAGREGEVLAKTYNRITYKNIYPNTDWVVYSKNNQLKYDFIVHAGGDAGQIKLKYEGAETTTLKDGAFVAIAPFGSITEQAPYCYTPEDNNEIASAYVLNENILSFSLPAIPAQGFVIDPVLEWATYYGGTGFDQGYHCSAIDMAGNAYLAGSVASITNIATTGAFLTTLTPDGGYIAKFSPAGVRQWGTYYPGEVGAICTDAFGNIFISGHTEELTNIATPGAHQTIYGGKVTATGTQSGVADAYLAKFNSAGARIWGSYYGGSHNERGSALVCDAAGNVYLGGYTRSTNAIAIGGTHQISFSGGAQGFDGFIVKFNPGGVRQWGTYYGGSGGEYLTSLACDELGHVYAGGTTGSQTGIASTGAHQTSITGPAGFLVKLNATTGTRVWGTYYGTGGGSGTIGTAILGVAVDHEGNICISGTTRSPTGIASPGAYQTAISSTHPEGCLAKFNSSGVRQWGTYYGRSGTDGLGAVVFDASGDIYVAGQAWPQGLATVGAWQGTNAGSIDVVVGQFDPAGNLVWATYYGGTAADAGSNYLQSDVGHRSQKVISSNGSRLVVCGTTSSTSGIATTGSHQPVYGGNTDAFLLSALVDTAVYVSVPFTDTVLCPGDTIMLPYTVAPVFLNGNVFTAQLSDANGDFTNAIDVGGITATTADSISVIIPRTATAGSNYLIRIAASLPARYSYNVAAPLRIKAAPVMPQAGSNTPLCSGQSLNLSVTTSTTGVSYAWAGPNSFADNVQNPTISAVSSAAAGDYRVKVTLAATGCALSDTTTVSVTPLPIAPMASNNGPVCSGNSLQLTAAAAPGSNYNWTGPQSFSSSLPNPVISNTGTAQSGTYTVTATVNGCTSAPTTTSVTIKPTPTTPVANSNSPVCLGGILNLSASSSPGSSYNWTGPNGYTATVQNPSISPAAKADEGIYTVVATLNGCPSAPASTGPVEVNVAAIVGAYASPGDTVCAGTNVQFVGFPQGAGTNPAIVWYKNGQVVGNNKVYRDSTLVTGDKVWCTVTATGICATPVVVSTDTFRMVVLNIKTHPKVTIQATPEPTGDPDQGIHFLAVATHGGPEPKYQWYINDVPTGGNTLNISMAGVVIGTEIKVEMISNDPCADQPYAVDSLLVQFPTGIDGQQRKGGLRLYPNPNKGSFTISGVTAGELNVSIVNALGQEVYSARYAGVNGSQAIDASLVPGNYLIKLQTEGGMEVLRFVVD